MSDLKFRTRFVVDTIGFDRGEYRQPLRVMGRRIAKTMRTIIRSGSGGAPQSRTGQLARSITSKVTKSGLVLSVGPRKQGKADNPRNGFYGRFLQHGTRYVAPMDFIDQTLRKERSYIERVISGATEGAVK